MVRLRKSRSDSGEVCGKARSDERRRRSGRGWGPFSGGQLTTIIVTFAILMLFPVGAWALSFTNVAITDPGGVNRAKVDSTGALKIGDGTGPLTVDGITSARPIAPASAWSASEDATFSAIARLLGPTTSAVSITSLDASHDDAAGRELFLYAAVIPAAATTCATANWTSSFTLFHVRQVPLGDSFVQSFPTPLRVPAPAAGSKLCIAMATDAGVMTVNASGFYG